MSSTRSIRRFLSLPTEPAEPLHAEDVMGGLPLAGEERMMPRLSSDEALALSTAIKVHASQKDRDGQPHVHHVTRVANAVPADCKTVAWLHDTLEDSELTPEALFDLGFDTCTIHAVVTLTRQEGETYADYIDRIIARKGAPGRIARVVKEADLLDNIARCIEARDPAVERYGRALGRLWADR